MGSRGPAQVSTEQLAKRGSSLVSGRKKIAREDKPLPEKKSKLHFEPFTFTKKQIEKICRGGINGYDPWATADSGQWFDPAAAREIVKFFHTELVHVKGKKANHGFVLERWEIAALGNLFGWKNEDGSRRYRVCLWFVPRKNGKTPLAAGIILYGLLKDDEPGAEIYGTASTYSQAALVFAHARGMVERNEWMNDACQIFKGQAKSIELRSDHSIYAVKASEGLAAHGWNTHMGLIDELHAQPDGELKEALETSVASEDRIQPLLMYLTTSDYDQPSVCNDEVDFAQKVKDGVDGYADSAYLPVMYGASRKDDWKDEAVWERANPNIDVSVSRAYLRRKCAKAEKSPADLNSFLRLHLNIRTSTDVLWLDTEVWDKGYRPDIDLSGRRCTAGLDISSTRDITAYVTLFALDDGFYYVLPKFWAPEEKIKSRDPKLSDRVDYQKWHAQGWITSTPGNTVDYGRMRADIVEYDKQHRIIDMGVDRLFQGEETCQKLMDMGFAGRVFAFGQGFASMTAPCKRFDELFYEGKLLHDGNPVMRWMVANTVAKMDEADNRKPDKKKSTGKIDGVVGAIMALGRMMMTKQSVYASRGLQTL